MQLCTVKYSLHKWKLDHVENRHQEIDGFFGNEQT